MIVVVGLSHRTAPIEVREKIALPKDQIPAALAQVTARSSIGEAMLISTCNRVELVVAGRQGMKSNLDLVASEAVAALGSIAPAVREHLYVRAGTDAVHHLFRVASSLDSLVLGEPQILGQVKDAFELARATGTVGGCLHRTVPRAIRAAKRVRTETELGSGQVSVPSVAVDLSKQIFGELQKRTVVLIGSGEMAETVAKLLKNAGTRLLVVGRNPARVSVLAAAVGGEARAWDELPRALIEADVVITSTSSPSFVVDREAVAATRKKRKGRSLFFIDLAVPRDIDPEAGKLDGMFLYNIDDFERVVSETRTSRAREAEAAERIVADETAGWERWAEAAQVTPMIVALRAQLGGVLHAELDKSMKTRLKHLSKDDRAALETMLEAALNKMLHAPSALLRQVAVDHEYESWRVDELCEALTQLFELDTEQSSVEASEPRPAGERAEPRATGTNGK